MHALPSRRVNDMPPWLQIVLGSVAAYYVISPLIIRWIVTTSVYAQYTQPLAEALPATVVEFFESHSRFLEQAGFEFCTYVLQTKQVRGNRTYISCWQNRDRGQAAAVIVIKPPVGRAVSCLEFGTITVNPLCTVMSSNVKSSTIYSGLPWRHVRYFPDATLAELQKVHAWREHNFFDATAERYLPEPTFEAFAALQTSEDLFLFRQLARSGIYAESKRVGQFRMTVFGAYLITFRLLPPAKQFRDWMHRRAAAREWESAQRESLSPATNVQLTSRSPFEDSLSTDRLGYA